MATNTYDIKINSAQAERALASLQGSLGKLNGAFGTLQGIVAGFAVGSFIANAYKMADSIYDIHEATGITIGAIKGFQEVLKTAGGDSESASTGIGKLNQAIEAAAQGSKEMQDKFLKLGIGLQELRGMSEEDILKTIITRLGQMEEGSDRAALGMALFGKSFKNIGWSSVSSGFDSATKTADTMTNSIKSAAKANDALVEALSTIQSATVVALQPLSNMVVALSANQENVVGLVRVLTTLVAAYAAIWTWGKLVGLWTAMSAALTGLAAAAKIATVSFGGLAAVFGRLLGIFGVIATGFLLINDAVKAISGSSIVEWVQKTAKEMGLWTDSTNKASAAQAEHDRLVKEGYTNRDVVDAMAKQKEAIRAIAVSYQEATAAAVEKYAADTNVIGASERQKLVVQEINAAYEQYRQQFTKLTNEYDKLRVGTESEKKAAQELYPEFAKLTEAYQEQKSTIGELTAARATANEQLQFELFKTKERIDLENQLMDIQDQIAKTSMSEIERKYYDIDAAARKSAKSAIEAEAARRGITADQMDAASVKAYYDAAYQGSERLKAKTKEQYEQSRTFSAGWKKAFQEYADNANNAAKQAERIFNKLTQGLEDLLVDFVKTGKFEWKNFAASMMEELLRSQIQQTFSNVLGGITDLFGGGDTGQGRGASPSNPVYVADVLSGGGAGAGGGVFGNQGGGVFGNGGSTAYGMGSLATGRGDPFAALGSLFDFGSKPYETTNAPSDWFSATQADNFYEPWKNTQSSGGLWDSISSGTSGLWDAVSTGVSDLFSGWFANGGNIPAGKFGIVGERGPELASGPTTITPLSGLGGTNVTYNINAVDAASFKSMIAADPGFIHAVAMQGASGVPRR